MNGDLATPVATPVATAIADFLAHKRALGRKYQTEEATLRLLLVFAERHGLAELRQLTPALLDEFVASRPRTRARSFNHLVGVLGCFLDPAAPAGLTAAPNPSTRDRSALALPFRRQPRSAAARGRRRPARQPEGNRSRADLPHHLCPLLRPRAASRGGVRPSPR